MLSSAIFSVEATNENSFRIETLLKYLKKIFLLFFPSSSSSSECSYVLPFFKTFAQELISVIEGILKKRFHLNLLREPKSGKNCIVLEGLRFYGAELIKSDFQYAM